MGGMKTKIDHREGGKVSMGSNGRHVSKSSPSRPSTFLSPHTTASRPRRRPSSLLLYLVGIIVVCVYLVGLHHGIGIIRTVEGDMSEQIWTTFLDLFDQLNNSEWRFEGDDVDVDDDGGILGSQQDDDDMTVSQQYKEQKDDVGVKREETTDSTEVEASAEDGAAKEGVDLAVVASALKSVRRRDRRPQEDAAVEALYTAPQNLLLPKPIINVGFPKAGTSTIFSFFHCNGLRAQHWLCCDPQDHPGRTEKEMLMSRCMIENMIADRPLFEECGNYDVYTEINGPRSFVDFDGRTLLEDGSLLPSNQSTVGQQRLFFPQHYLLDKIHQQYPDATFILNQRPVDDWVKSVVKWNNLGLEIVNEFYFQNSTHQIIVPEGTLSSSSRRPYNINTIGLFLKTVYEYHTQFIRDWVKVHPSHALVEVDITDAGAGRILANAFGLKEECWGHFNQNKGKNRRGYNGRMGLRGEPRFSSRPGTYGKTTDRQMHHPSTQQGGQQGLLAAAFQGLFGSNGDQSKNRVKSSWLTTDERQRLEMERREKRRKDLYQRHRSDNLSRIVGRERRKKGNNIGEEVTNVKQQLQASRRKVQGSSKG